jgi:hypothetical protein
MSGEYYTCAFCGEQGETAIAGDDCGTLGWIEYKGEWYHSLACLRSYIAQFESSTLKSRIDRSQIQVAVIVIPTNTNLISLDVTDKIEALGVIPANVRAIASPDYPVACAVKGRADDGRYYMDVAISPQQSFEVNVTVLVFELV